MSDEGLIDFTYEFALEDRHLVLRYRLANRGPRDLYLLNRLYRTIPAWELGPDVIYVHLDSENRTIWLNKKTADIPGDVLVNAPVAPFVTPVRAGEAFDETVRVPLPVQDYRQYGSHAGGPSKDALKTEPVEVTYDQVYVTLGYYWRMDGTEEEVRNIQGDEVVFPISPQGAGFPEFGELQSELVHIQVPVLEYREPGESP